MVKSWHSVPGDLKTVGQRQNFPKGLNKNPCKNKKKMHLILNINVIHQNNKCRGATNQHTDNQCSDNTGRLSSHCKLRMHYIYCTVSHRGVYISLYIHNFITLHSGSIAHCMAAAAEGGGTVIVQPYTGSEDRFNAYNQCILIHQYLHHSAKHSK